MDKLDRFIDVRRLLDIVVLLSRSAGISGPPPHRNFALFRREYYRIYEEWGRLRHLLKPDLRGWNSQGRLPGGGEAG